MTFVASIAILADGMTVANALSIINLGLSTAITIGLYVLKQKTDEIKDLKESAEQSAREAVKAQFATETQGLKTAMSNFEGRLSECTRRLDLGDGEFRKLVEKGYEQRIEMMQMLSNLSDSIGQRMVSKDDVRELLGDVKEDLDRVGREVQQLAIHARQGNGRRGS